MELFRIAKKEFAILDGIGGVYYPGRWHNAGHPIIYAAQSRSLAALETLVHLSNTQFLKTNMVLCVIKVPDDIKIQSIEEKSLPKSWRSHQYLSETRALGDNFLKKQKNLMCKVPSAIIENEYNFIINPLHLDFMLIELVKVNSFQFDSRLF